MQSMQSKIKMWNRLTNVGTLEFVQMKTGPCSEIKEMAQGSNMQQKHISFDNTFYTAVFIISVVYSMEPWSLKWTAVKTII